MRSDGVKVHFDEARGRAPADAELRATVKSLERPIFAYSYEVIDNRHGNGDGRVQKGEDLTMYLTVKNVGKGRSYETQANLRNLSGDGLLLHDGRFDMSNMMPGDTRRVAFTFDVETGAGRPGGEARALDPRRGPARGRRREGAHPHRRPDAGRRDHRRAARDRQRRGPAQRRRTRRGASSRGSPRAPRPRRSGPRTGT